MSKTIRKMRESSREEEAIFERAIRLAIKGAKPMPYTKENPPEAIKGLPDAAQTIWIAAYNAASKEYKGDEEKSNATAWAAVKQKFEQDKDGKWIAKTEEAKATRQRGEIIALALGDLTNDAASTRTIQVLRAGSFVDMHGTEVEVGPTDLDTYVSNSNALIGAEQVPVELGHPADAGAPAAAWYKRFFKQTIGNVEWVCAEIELTALGTRSLSEQLYKYFSANLDLAGKLICGGGFVNRPAVKGQQPVGVLAEYLTPSDAENPTPDGEDSIVTLLAALLKRAMAWLDKSAPTEISDNPATASQMSQNNAPAPQSGQGENHQGGESPMAETTNVQNATPTVPAPAAPLSAPIPAVVLPVTPLDPALSPEQQIARVREEAQLAAQNQIREFQALLAEERKHATEEAQAQMARNQKVAGLSVQLTTGRRQFPYKSEELEAILGQMSDADRDLIAPVLIKVHDAGLVEMGERGSSAPGRGINPLPKYAQPLLTAWLSSKGTVEEFFAQNPELGGAHLYDLSEFEKK